ncbi:beta-N-acetylglucosaminidase domain-containing protein [Fictibacillus sp. KIGAM418]|uniref:Beta-N-acetylglucosaminidase domain-containing protein n=1 Tax=Fictibacillus marinisediminis TaxID=2878389 RepID=A0A9X1XFT5_9BACL|nr:beta-N-acetylglucosaminidase domain-containing protein [Fictibacillus marinisediminis]MCK6259100.1 beta-N-acetylglucosaminidase domain-containing protein [Fictibacillus marinisediminis]
MPNKMPENYRESIRVSPVPQSIEIRDDGFPLTPIVWLVTEAKTPASAMREVEKALYHAGVKEIEIRSNFREIEAAMVPVVIYLGELAEDEAASKALVGLHVDPHKNLQAEGYVIASGTSPAGTNQIILAGVDEAGTFYAAQTFRQLLTIENKAAWMPSVIIHDWPSMPIRGAIEGFYGPPWSHQDRLSQLTFYSEHKMNAYIYAPKDDPYHREKWRDPYPESKMDEIRELVDTAKRNHITFTFAISPGNTIAFSNDADFQDLLNKAQAVWDIGVRSFALYLDDIDPALRSSQDQETFGGDQHPPAAAQAFLLNRFNDEFIKKHPEALPLITVPTEYHEENTSPYRERFAGLVQHDIIVQWTGIGIVAPVIPAKDARYIHGIFQHPLLIWDNYPVNDIDRNRLFLAPLYGREAELCKEESIIGITANPMNEAEASKIPLFTIADYMWNALNYQPDHSLERSVKEFAGKASDALKLFVESCYATILNNHAEPLSIRLQLLMDNFWRAKETESMKTGGDPLLQQFYAMKEAPSQLKRKLENQNFLKETEPYLLKLALYGAAGEAAVRMLLMEEARNANEAQAQRNILEGLMEKIKNIPQKLSISVMDPFLHRALFGPDFPQNSAMGDSASETLS